MRGGEPLPGTDEDGDVVTLLQCLRDDVLAGSARGAEYQNLFSDRCSLLSARCKPA